MTRSTSVGVHFVGGWIGTLCVGFFSTTGTNSLGNDGILYGGKGQFGGWNLLLHQFLAAGAVTVFSFVGTLIIGYAINLVIKHAGARGAGSWKASTRPCTASRRTTSGWCRHLRSPRLDQGRHPGRCARMKQVTAVIKPFKLNDVKAALGCSGSTA